MGEMQESQGGRVRAGLAMSAVIVLGAVLAVLAIQLHKRRSEQDPNTKPALPLKDYGSNADRDMPYIVHTHNATLQPTWSAMDAVLHEVDKIDQPSETTSLLLSRGRRDLIRNNQPYMN